MASTELPPILPGPFDLNRECPHLLDQAIIEVLRTHSQLNGSSAAAWAELSWGESTHLVLPREFFRPVGDE